MFPLKWIMFKSTFAKFDKVLKVEAPKNHYYTLNQHTKPMS
jgi:hypothetical protein